jgi:hypothetical protein
MLAGRPAFKGSNEYQTFQKILKLNYTYPTYFPPPARELCEALLKLDPDDRLGAQGISDIMSHSFFNGVSWNDIRRAACAPPPMLALVSKDDVLAFRAVEDMAGSSTPSSPQSPAQADTDDIQMKWYVGHGVVC